LCSMNMTMGQVAHCVADLWSAYGNAAVVLEERAADVDARDYTLPSTVLMKDDYRRAFVELLSHVQ